MKKSRWCFQVPRGYWRKSWKITKMFSVLMCALTFSVSAAAFAQHERVTLNFRQATVRQVLNEIQRQTRLSFIYNTEQTEQLGQISVEAHNESVTSLLDRILTGTGLTWKIQEDLILISQAGPETTAIPQAQEQETVLLTGTVTDIQKMPLPGVTVKISGTSFGTSTDANGKFRFSYPKNKAQIVLEFSFVGMQTTSVKYAGQKEIDVILYEDQKELDEVVVTGYQVLDKRTQTSAITTVKAEDIMIPGVTSIDQMLEGRIPEMTFMLNSGEVGATPRLRVRGTSTLLGNREPLWVLDGIVMTDPVDVDPDDLNNPDYLNIIGNAIAGINPQDIERIDVLKDASATALYGTRAANGVIVVTTKKGRIGKPVLSYSHSSKITRRPRYTDRNINLMNSQERVRFGKELADQHYIFPTQMPLVGYEGALYRLQSGLTDYDTFLNEVTWYEQVNTDWFDILTEDAFSHNHTLSISGGTDQLRYYSSVGYTKDNDVIKGQGISRYTGNLSLESDLTKWLKASMDFNANISERNYEQSAVGSVNYAYTTSRAIAAYEEGGDLSYYQKRYNSFYRYDFNILNERANSYTKQENSGFDLTSRLIFRFTDWLNGDVLFNYAVSNADNEDYWGESTYHVACIRKSNYGVAAPSDSELPYGGELSEQNTRNKTYSLRAQLNLNKYFGEEEKHNINGALGYEMSSSRYKGYQNTSRGYYADRGKNFTSVGASDYSKYTAWVMNNQPKITDNLTNLIGAYLTLIYSYRNLFSLNANMRYDGSNKFGSRSNEKLLPVWAVSSSFNLAELPALSADWLNFLAIKMSYGYQGNMLDGQTPVLLLKNNPRDSYYNKFTSSVASYPNPELNWEKTGSFNTGLELAVLDNRIQISGDFYYKRTKDAFMNKPISNVNGLTSYTVNSGEVINRGYNISLNLVPVKTRDFKWSLSTTISKTKNKLNTRPDAEQHELSDFLNGSALVKGQPVSTFYSYRFIGLSPVDGGPLFDDYSEQVDLLKNLNKYETFTTVLKPTGKRDPSMSGSVYNNFIWKRFRANLTLAYSLGAKLRQSRILAQRPADDENRFIYSEFNANRALLNRWKAPGDEKNTIIPAIIGTNQPGYYAYNRHWTQQGGYEGIIFAETAWDMYDYCDARVVSGNYLKCSNVSVAYVLPEKWLKTVRISRFEATLSATNLFTVCSKKLKGQTPTQSVFSQVQLSDRPTISLGFNVSF